MKVNKIFSKTDKAKRRSFPNKV